MHLKIFFPFEMIINVPESFIKNIYPKYPSKKNYNKYFKFDNGNLKIV